MFHRVLVCVFGAVALLLEPGIGAAQSYDESVVRVVVNRRPPNPVQPWTKGSPSEVSGTGFVIDGNRLLTNAHVIYYATQIYIQPNRSAEKYPAKVIAIAPELDLAVLNVDDA